MSDREGACVSESSEAQSRRLDDEAAALTDALLRGESPAASDEAQPLFDVAQRLDALIAPRTAPSAAFQNHLRGEVEAAWSERSPQRPARLVRAALLWTLAAAAVLLLVVLIIPGSASFPVALSGAAASDGAGWVQVPWRAAIALLGFGGLGLWWLFRRRR